MRASTMTAADELYETAFARISEGSLQDAVSCLQRALALDPGHARYATALAKVYDMLGDREQAGAWLERSLRLRRRTLTPQ
jgi:Flp pilus assembly protein TadD